MRRSGHHAIVLWLGNHIDGSALYINDVYPNKKAERQNVIPGKVLTSPDVGRSIEPCEVRHTELHTVRDFYSKPRSFSMLSKYEDTVDKNWDCLLLSFENWYVNCISNSVFAKKHNAWYGQTEQVDNVLVLRDPFNCLASLLSGDSTWPIPLENIVMNFIDLWKNHAREFLGQTEYFSNLTTINFNSWHINSGYRMNLMKKLGTKIDNSSFQYIPEFGKGSSFTGYRKQGRASELRLQDRWRTCQDLAEFRLLTQDQELLDMANSIFNLTVYTDLQNWIRSC